MNLPTTIIYSLLGGILPALIWLAFWLREDGKKPEPKGLILRTFLFGMLAVLVVLPFQIAVKSIVPTLGVLSFLLWAAIEEWFKFCAAYYGGLRSKENNEPLDPLIYMITAALGFVALENALFIVNPLLEQNVLGGIITGNLRFIGTSLLHTVSSGIIGIALALLYYRRGEIRLIWSAFAMLLAIVFHTLFNLFIMSEGKFSNSIAFVSVWMGIAIILLLFEKIKTIRNV
jgi:RsiW-degrading membrane proteinase PrsW (M82 family)